MGWMARLGQLYCFVADSVTAAGQKNTSCWCVEINLERTEILKGLFSASAGKENNISQNPPPNQCEQIFESSSQHNCEQKTTFDFRRTLAHLCLSPDSYKLWFVYRILEEKNNLTRFTFHVLPSRCLIFYFHSCQMIDRQGGICWQQVFKICSVQWWGGGGGGEEGPPAFSTFGWFYPNISHFNVTTTLISLKVGLFGSQILYKLIELSHLVIHILRNVVHWLFWRKWNICVTTSSLTYKQDIWIDG